MVGNPDTCTVIQGLREGRLESSHSQSPKKEDRAGIQKDFISLIFLTPTLCLALW